ncbi:hypothetical protein [Luteimonas salinilitoris]|uniref:Uncharacterized protein n=1 Tax=Luteimonas salinilitoris TaxID=3237697 RepID=A0ABV4HV88_9GAMM
MNLTLFLTLFLAWPANPASTWPALRSTSCDARLQPHPAYRRLGPDAGTRRTAYRPLAEAGLPLGEAEALALHTRQQKP